MIVRHSIVWRRAARHLARPLAEHTAVAVAIIVGYLLLGDRWVVVPDLPISILAASLGILLGFRNNSAYDRWWEARTIWGALVNASRRMARQVLTLLPAPRERAGDDAVGDEGLFAAREARRSSPVLAATHSDAFPVVQRAGDGAVRDQEGLAHAIRTSRGAGPDTPGADEEAEVCSFPAASREARDLVYAQIGFVNALRCHLRRQDPLPELAPFFSPAVLDALRGEQNVPSAILVWMAGRLRRAFGRAPGTESTLRLVALDETLNELTNIMGACERIKNTPIPRQYDFLPRVMVRAYLVLLPLSVVDDLGVLTPLVTAVLAVLFLSLDAIGREVEAPFENDIHDTPMTALSRTIEINLRQMLGERTLPPPVQPTADGFLY